MLCLIVNVASVQDRIEVERRTHWIYSKKNEEVYNPLVKTSDIRKLKYVNY
jgi:hypothetical protein